MNDRCSKLVRCAAMAVACLLFQLNLGMTTAQEEPTFKLYRLKHATAEQVHEVLDTMLQGSVAQMSTDPRTNAIIVSGSDSIHQRIQKLIQEIDKPKQLDDSSTHVEAVEIRERSAEEIAQMVSELIANNPISPVRIAVNEELGTIFVSGKPSDVETVKKLISTLIDKSSKSKMAVPPPVNCIVKLTWLVDTSELENTEGFGEPHQSLDLLVKNLESDGTLKSAKVLTTLQTYVQVSTSELSINEFDNSGSRLVSSNSIVANIKASGYVQDTNDGNFRMGLSVNLGSGNLDLPISTTISLPRNHPVAFSVSDWSSFRSALVVEMVDPD